jgi:hypothetical protein
MEEVAGISEPSRRLRCGCNNGLAHCLEGSCGSARKGSAFAYAAVIACRQEIDFKNPAIGSVVAPLAQEILSNLPARFHDEKA